MVEFSQLIGVTSQQIFKYEHGLNSISAGRLYELARQSNTPVEYFFEGFKSSEYQPPASLLRLIDVMRSIDEMKSDRHRKLLGQLVRYLAS
jgi:transcriptional regulator with XRE-family HTH domain